MVEKDIAIRKAVFARELARDKKFIRKVFVNKRNNQMSVPLSRKQIRAVDPTVKFGENLFVELTFIKRRKK